MATPLAGANVERGLDAKVKWSMENRRASGGCHPRLVERSRYAGLIEALGAGWWRHDEVGGDRGNCVGPSLS